MPLMNDMTTGQYRNAIRAINLKLKALSLARKKLRERRDTGVTRNEGLLIELEMTRLKFRQDDLIDWKAVFKLNQKSLPAPSAAAIQKMREKVQAIADLNVADKNARVIVRAAIEVVGTLQSASLT